jgi:hypothetical protein
MRKRIEERGRMSDTHFDPLFPESDDHLLHPQVKYLTPLIAIESDTHLVSHALVVLCANRFLPSYRREMAGAVSDGLR